MHFDWKTETWLSKTFALKINSDRVFLFFLSKMLRAQLRTKYIWNYDEMQKKMTIFSLAVPLCLWFCILGLRSETLNSKWNRWAIASFEGKVRYSSLVTNRPFSQQRHFDLLQKKKPMTRGSVQSVTPCEHTCSIEFSLWRKKKKTACRWRVLKTVRLWRNTGDTLCIPIQKLSYPTTSVIFEREIVNYWTQHIHHFVKLNKCGDTLSIRWCVFFDSS